MPKVFETIRYEVDLAVARVTMNRPEVRNGLDRKMTLELLDAVKTAESDPMVRALLLTGEGSAFCSGADLGAVNTSQDPKLRAAQGAAAMTFVREAINPLVLALHNCSKPTLAAVNGPAVGGGIGLALAADIAIACESACFMPKFTPVLALIPDLGCTWLLPRLVGRARAYGATMFGATIKAREAEEWGLIWRCSTDADFAQETQKLASQLASGPPFAFKSLKQAMRASSTNSFAQQLDLELELSAKCCGSEEFAEAAAAFMEKRSPNFKRG